MITRQGNLERILTSIRIAKERGATLRVGPELEITCVMHNEQNIVVNSPPAEDMDVKITSWKVALAHLHF